MPHKQHIPSARNKEDESRPTSEWRYDDEGRAVRSVTLRRKKMYSTCKYQPMRQEHSNMEYTELQIKKTFVIIPGTKIAQHLNKKIDVNQISHAPRKYTSSPLECDTPIVQDSAANTEKKQKKVAFHLVQEPARCDAVEIVNNVISMQNKRASSTETYRRPNKLQRKTASSGRQRTEDVQEDNTKPRAVSCIANVPKELLKVAISNTSKYNHVGHTLRSLGAGLVSPSEMNMILKHRYANNLPDIQDEDNARKEPRCLKTENTRSPAATTGYCNEHLPSLQIKKPPQRTDSREGYQHNRNSTTPTYKSQVTIKSVDFAMDEEQRPASKTMMTIRGSSPNINQLPASCQPQSTHTRRKYMNTTEEMDVSGDGNNTRHTPEQQPRANSDRIASASLQISLTKLRERVAPSVVVTPFSKAIAATSKQKRRRGAPVTSGQGSSSYDIINQSYSMPSQKIPKNTMFRADHYIGFQHAKFRQGNNTSPNKMPSMKPYDYRTRSKFAKVTTGERITPGYQVMDIDS